MRMDAFRYTFFAQEVIFGPGSVAQLGEACARAGWQKMMLCTTEHFRARGHLTPIEAALGERLVATFERVLPHVPESQVAEVTALAAEHEVDAVIGLGGGSSIGTAKAVSLALDERRTGSGQTQAATPTDQPLVPVIAIPTTYAGSEMTPVYGVTRQIDGMARKVTVTDPKVAPMLTIYDPLLTLDLPPRMTAGTGINAVAHCVEALYSIRRNPLSTAAALAGLRAISRALPRCYAAGDEAEARGEMLAGSFLAGTALSNVAMGLHHGICHVLGGTTGIAHGDANSVMLPHVMRFNLDATVPQLAQATEAMGIDVAGRSAEEAAELAAQRVAEWVEQMQLPRRLRDLGVREEQLPPLAQMAFANRTVQNNPKPIRDAAQIEALLRQAW
jgi:alcohol dehydrogenase class IV